MANIGALVATLGVDTKGLDRAGKEVKSFESKATKSFVRIGASLAAAFSVRKVVQIADAMTLVEGRLSLVTKSSENLIEVQKELLDLSNESRVGYKETADLYARMARSTEELGVSQGHLLQVTETINKALIVSGASAVEANAALVQLSQGLASGELRGEELRSVMEQTPRLARAMADGLGIGIGALREMGHAGELSSQVVIKSLLSQGDVIEKEFGKMPLTVGQALTVLNNEIGFFISGASKGTSATQLLARGIVRVAEIISDVSKSGTMQEIWSTIGTGIQMVIDNVDKLILGFKLLAVHFAVGKVTALTTALMGASKAMLTLRTATMLAAQAGRLLGRVFLYGTILEGISIVIDKWKIFNKLVKETPATWLTVGKIAIDQFANAVLNGFIALARGIYNSIRLVTDPIVEAFWVVGKSLPDLLFRRTTLEQVAAEAAEASGKAFTTALARVGDDFETDMNRRLIKIASPEDLDLLAKVSTSIEEPPVPELPGAPELPEFLELPAFFKEGKEQFEPTALPEHIKERLKLLNEFNQEVNQLGLSQFGIERMQVEEKMEMYRQAGADRVELERLTGGKLTQIAAKEQQAKLSLYSDMAGKIAGTFESIAQAGGKQSKTAFLAYKAFAIAQAGIAGAMAYVKTLAEPDLPWPGNIAMANVIAGMTAVQVGMIAGAQPPSFDQGGVTTKEGLFHAGNIQEAHIPLKGGRVPIAMPDEEEKPETPPVMLNIQTFDAKSFKSYLRDNKDALSDIIQEAHSFNLGVR